MSLVVGGTKRPDEAKDSSGKVTVSIFEFKNPTMPIQGHNDIQVNVDADEGWVCVGGGGSGNGSPGNFLTRSCPSQDEIGNADWKGWRISSRDHENPDPCQLLGFAIGMKVDGLTREQLISNLKLFSADSVSIPHPEGISSVENGFLLLGGGFDVLDQTVGNMATATFPISTFSWMARSEDEKFASPSRIRVFAIGIRANLLKPHPTGPSIGNVVTTYASTESTYALSTTATQMPLSGFALCGGGAVVHTATPGPDNNDWAPMFLWNLMPGIVGHPSPTPPEQLFNGSAIQHLWPAEGTLTAYAMGIKFTAECGEHAHWNGTECVCDSGFHMDNGICIVGPPPPPPPPPSITCNNNLQVIVFDSSASDNVNLPPTKTIDNDLISRWISSSVPAHIIFDLGSVRPVCRVDIAWADGSSRLYSFTISVSDTDVFDPVQSFTSSKNASLQRYDLPPNVKGKFVKITVDAIDPASPKAQISEVDIFGS